jgi:hypothetical protein
MIKNMKIGRKTTPQLAATNTADTFTILEANPILFRKQQKKTIIIAATTKQIMAKTVFAVGFSMIEKDPIPEESKGWVRIYTPKPIKALTEKSIKR